MARTPNGASSIYLGKDGYWHGRVTVGLRDNGRPDRRHVMGTRADVTRKVRAGAAARRRIGSKSRANLDGRAVAHALGGEHRRAVRSAPFVRENTIAGYRVAVNLARNPAMLAKGPRLRDTEVEPYSVDEIKLLLKAAMQGRNGARWAVALALGLRQGEALGLRWDDVDLDAGTLFVRRGRLRPRWEHGCNGTCERKFGGHCPERVALRDETAETKSRAGRRRIGLPDQLVELLRSHRDEQDRERVAAAHLWTDGGWVFSTLTGRPLNPRTDWTGWKKLLTRAGVRDGRLHDARHTAATVLLLLGVPERAVMGVMGWSNTAMAARYQHVTAAIQRDIAGRIGGLIWEVRDGPADTE